MDNKDFVFSDWMFHRETDGSLRISPVASKGGTQPFGQPQTADKGTITSQEIVIPQEHVYRLLGYCLTGNPNDTQVIEKVKGLSLQTV